MKTKIYWAPVDDEQKDKDWSILYPDPTVLDHDLKKKMAKNIDKKSNLFFCPAVKDLTSKIAVLKCPIASQYKVKNNEFQPVSKNYVNLKFTHKPNFENNFMFEMCLSYVFFAEEESVNMTFSSPYFSNSPHLQYGSIIPGTFNIAKWFRNVNMEFNLWDDITEFKIKRNEPLAYVHFECKNEIELVRFDFNERLHRLRNTCATACDWERFVPLAERYQRFKEARFRSIVLKEIKKNIVD